MLIEAAKPVALILCMVSLGAVFCTAFFSPVADLEQRSWQALVLMSFAAGIALVSGLIFREPTQTGVAALARTLPVQMFCWAVGLMVILFATSWYLETHCIFYKDVRRL